MTIVESALERARELGNGVPPRTAAPAMLSPVPRAMPTPVPTVSAAATSPYIPHTRLRSQALKLDVGACRENRLLLAPGEHDEGAVAAYRMLRTRMLHRIRAQKWTTIGITSTAPGDGKTLTALNLSFSLAREKNSEVVLLDLDMRNPSICKTLDIAPPRELRDFFEQPSGTDDLFFSIGVDNLVIAGQNTSTQQASELLASSRFEELIAHVRESTVNPIVLIDLPPVLSTDDVLVLAPRLDALLLVVAEGKTDRGALDKATELLSEFQLAGVVLNQSRDRSGYAYGYDAGYGPSAR
jgi:protein-tyrosine kinase